MKRQVKIKTDSVIAIAELFNTKATDAIWQALPLESTVNTWGDEIYFRIPVQISLESGQEILDIGDLGYWPPGSAFCIFFGKTPVSSKDEIRAASAVDIFGKVVGDARVFKDVEDGARIVVEGV